MIFNEKGYAIPLVLLVIIAFVFLSTALWHFGTAETRQVSHQEHRSKAHYLARSGLSVTERVLEKRIEILGEDEKVFYLYGSIENDGSGSFEWEFKEEEDAALADDEDIEVVVEWEGVEEGYGSGIITTYGKYLEVKETIKRNFEFYTGIDGDTANWMNPGIEGRIRSGNVRDEWEVPVSFTNEVEGEDGVYDSDGSTGTFSAPVISFIDERYSFLIKNKNARPIFEANYISFYGNIVFEEQGNAYLQVRDEGVFTGEDLKEGIAYLENISDEDDIEEDDIKYDNYGLFYLGEEGDNVLEQDYEVRYNANIFTESDEGREPIHDDLDPGFYFFPDITDESPYGLNLRNYGHLDKLVKIKDIDQFDLDILNIGLVFGSYR